MTEVFIIPSQLITGYPESAGLIMSVCGKKLRSKQFNINCFSQTTIGTKYSKTTKYLCRSFKNIKRSLLFCSIRIIDSLQAKQNQINVHLPSKYFLKLSQLGNVSCFNVTFQFFISSFQTRLNSCYQMTDNVLVSVFPLVHVCNLIVNQEVQVSAANNTHSVGS